jgi:hypothetical protein
MEVCHVSNRFALSTDGITYEEAPNSLEPKVEFDYAASWAVRGDQQRLALGGWTMKWYFADQPITGEDYYWFLKWVTGNSQSIYVISKIPGEVINAQGDPLYDEMQGVMGRPTGEIASEEGEGQTFTDVSIDFWNLVPV